MTDDILDTIDGALHDWETSGDAMRWVPGGQRTEEDRPTEHSLRELLDRRTAQFAESVHRAMFGARAVVLNDIENRAAPTLAELDGITIAPMEIPHLMPVPERGQQVRIFDRNGEQISFTIGDVRVTADGTVTIIPEAAQ